MMGLLDWEMTYQVGDLRGEELVVVACDRGRIGDGLGWAGLLVILLVGG